MRWKLNISALFLLSIVCASCSKKYDSYYLSDNVVSIVVNSSSVFRFDEMTCQLSYNRDNRKFAAFRDDMSSYFILELGASSAVSDKIIADCILKYTTSNDVVTMKGLDFSVEKRDDSAGLLWLWCAEKDVFVIVRML